MNRSGWLIYGFAIALITGCSDMCFASSDKVIVDVEYQTMDGGPVNPWAEMERKERQYRAEIALLKARQAAYQEPPQRPTPSVLVRGNQALKIGELDNYPLPSYADEPAEDRKVQKQRPASNRIYTEYPGSHVKTWRFAPKRMEYR